jgi:integrase
MSAHFAPNFERKKPAKKPKSALPHGVSITNAVNGAGTKYYKVRLGKRFTGGEAVVRNFRELAQAQAWIFGATKCSTPREESPTCGAVELKRMAGASAFAFTPIQLAEAAWAFNALDGVSLVTAVKFYIARTRPAGATKRLSAMIDEHIRALAEDACSAAYIKNQRITCNVLARQLNDPPLAEITPEMIREVIQQKNWNPLNRRNYMRDWSMCFRRAVRFDYLHSNPLDKITRPRVSRPEPQIYTVREAQTLLESARAHFPEVLAFIAIGLFAGVRVEEMRRMDWSMVDFEHGFISLKAAVTKSNEPRDISISPALRLWLEICACRVGPLTPTVAFRRRIDALYTSVGFRKRNALRHSFASYFLASTQSPEKTQMALGQQTQSILFRHYRQVVRPEAAEAYWSIYPTNESGRCK